MTARVRICNCGLHKLHIGVAGVSWYWSTHTEDHCYMNEEDGPCWCGNAKSMHFQGHAPSWNMAAPKDYVAERERAAQGIQREKDKRKPGA